MNWKKWAMAMAAACALSAAGAIGAAAATVTSIQLVNPHLTTDGTASWEVSGSAENDEIERYQLQLSRQKNGSTKDDFKTATTTDVGSTEYYFNFTSTGRYRFKVRARLYSGNYTAWSDFSEFVVVTKDDVNGNWDDDWSGSSSVVGDGYTSYGPGYAVNGMPGGATLPSGGYGPGYANNQTTTSGQSYSPSANGTQTVNYGWVKGAEGWWYRHQDGSYPKNTWAHIDDKWYFFNANGYMQTGWIWWNNVWYYSLPEGPMATDWQNINEKWYYFNEAGVMQTGYQTIGGKTYYLDATGVRFTNGTTPDGHTFDANGVMIK